ncbi:MAG: PucC family protein [Gammaproteobacteria bacterium]|nr:PucC family protein [Gammaproteobacteria bacterium]TVQ46944.1 MAG: MFS transporter [Gammaproteobacteria bacterium]
MKQSLSRKAVSLWVNLGPRFLPFADVATDELPLSRLLRLSLFQVSVGMCLVLLAGTLNRVMIVELSVPASLVSVMIALPILFAPFRAFIGFRSDQHRSELGWRRVPFMWNGTLMQFGGLAIMPFALLVLAGGGQAAEYPPWVGQAAAGVSFLLIGAGMHTVQTVGLALATDLAPVESQPRVVGLMYVMLLLGMIASALIFGALLADFSAPRLIQVVQGAAVAAVLLNVVALWKQETRRPRRLQTQPVPQLTFGEAWARMSRGAGAIRSLVAVGIGTLAFSMADILLEPYGGQILGMTVAETTRLTAILALGTLIGFALASRFMAHGVDPLRVASVGAIVGIPSFLAVIFSAPIESTVLFTMANFAIGFGAALFSHGTLTSTMRLAPREQSGLALGAWGSVQATALGLGIAFSGIARDVITAVGIGADWGLRLGGAAAGYIVVYGVEIALLVATVIVIIPLVGRLRGYAMQDSSEASDVGLARQPTGHGAGGG